MNQLKSRSSETPLTSSCTPTGRVPSRPRRARQSLSRVVVACVHVATGLVLGGCSQKGKVKELKPEDVQPVNPNASADAQKNQRIKMAVAIRDGVMPPEPALKLKGGEQATPEVLEAYNQLLLRAMVQRREPPESLQELQRWPLPRLPTPPPGKRIVYDAANCIIRLEPP